MQKQNQASPKKWILVRFTDNWADEFNVDAVAVLSVDEWEAKKQILRAEWPDNSTTLAYGEFRNKPCFRASFGTNQSIEYQDVDAYLSKFVVTPVSSGWAKIFHKICGKSVVGVLPYRWLF